MAAVPEVGRADTEVSSRTTQQLYQQYGRQVYAFCLQRLRSREEAEDAVQTTFLNAFRALQKGTQTRFEQAWLYKIAHHVCLERAQSSGRRLQVESPSDLLVLQEVASAHAPEDPEQLLGVEDALAGMPANQRKAILLREWQGLSYREIGEELRISQSSVEMLIFRARRSLARALEEPQVAERKKARGGRMLNMGSLVTGLKTLFTGGAAVKMAAVAVTAGTVIAAGAKPVVHSVLGSDAHARPKAAAVQHAVTLPLSVVDVTPRALIQPVAHHAARKQHRAQPMLPAPIRAARSSHPARVQSTPVQPPQTPTTPATAPAPVTPASAQPTAQTSGPVVTPTSAPAAPAPAPQPAPAPKTGTGGGGGGGTTSTGSGGTKAPKTVGSGGSGSPTPTDPTTTTNDPPTTTDPQQPGTPTDQPGQGTGKGDPKGDNGHGKGRRGHDHGSGDGQTTGTTGQNQNQGSGQTQGSGGQNQNGGSGGTQTTTTQTTTGQTQTTPTTTTTPQPSTPAPSQPAAGQSQGQAPPPPPAQSPPSGQGQTPGPGNGQNPGPGQGQGPGQGGHGHGDGGHGHGR